MSPPRTPKRRRTKDTEKPVVSPYFSKIYSSPVVSPYRFSAVPHDGKKPASCAPLRDLDGEDDEDNDPDVYDEKLARDPLFPFHFRTFFDLYQRLYAAKPIMIQGGIRGLVTCVYAQLISLDRNGGRRPMEAFGCCNAPQ